MLEKADMDAMMENEPSSLSFPGNKGSETWQSGLKNGQKEH